MKHNRLPSSNSNPKKAVLPLRLGFLASHRGSSMRAIVEAIRAGRLDAEARVVISNNRDAGALEHARASGIPAYHLSANTHPDPAELDRAILDALRQHDVTLVILSGYMKKIGPLTLAAYQDRILNIHPALLPKFGGKGMYGKRVHEAVLAAREPVTGVTVHLIDEQYDHGPIIGQRTVPVLETDSVDTLAARVLECEKAFFVEILQRIAAGRIPGVR